MLDLKLLREYERTLETLLGIENPLIFEGEYEQGEIASPDAKFLLKLPGANYVRLCVEEKKVLRPGMIPHIKRCFDNWVNDGLCQRACVFSEYVPATLSQRLREEGIWFVDAAGNAYLEINDQLLIYVIGNRLHRTATIKGRYFTSGGARVLFYLLKHGPKIEVTYRELSAAASVSLDVISKVMNELIYDAIIGRPKQGKYEVRHPRRLLNMWAEAFAAKLHPKIVLGHYKSAYETDFQAIIREGIRNGSLKNAIVGGEYAADLLTDYLRAGSMTLYVSPAEFEIVKQSLKLAPSHEGPIEICEKFSSEISGGSEKQGVALADPALVYAELLASNEPRCGETALVLKEKYLRWVP